MGQIEPSQTDCLDEQDTLSVMYGGHRKKSRKIRPSSTVKLFVRPASSVHNIKNVETLIQRYARCRIKMMLRETA